MIINQEFSVYGADCYYDSVHFASAYYSDSVPVVVVIPAKYAEISKKSYNAEVSRKKYLAEISR